MRLGGVESVIKPEDGVSVTEWRVVLLQSSPVRHELIVAGDDDVWRRDGASHIDFALVAGQYQGWGEVLSLVRNVAAGLGVLSLPAPALRVKTEPGGLLLFPPVLLPVLGNHPLNPRSFNHGGAARLVIFGLGRPTARQMQIICLFIAVIWTCNL